jgi:hypothetical protein
VLRPALAGKPCYVWTDAKNLTRVEMASHTSEMLAACVRHYLAPLLAPIGLKEGPYPEPLSVGVVARALSRTLSANRTFYVTCWCDGGTGDNLRWRMDVRDNVGWRDLSTIFPFERPGYPPARPVGGTHTCLSEFQPFRGRRNFERAIQFLGPLLVTLHPQIAEQVPELREDIRVALTTDVWKAALEAAPRLWGARFVQGDIDPTEVPARVTFLGANLIVLDAKGERVSFKFPTAGIANVSTAVVSGWWSTPAGTRSATVLRIGDRRWIFDFSGKLVNEASVD